MSYIYGIWYGQRHRYIYNILCNAVETASQQVQVDNYKPEKDK